ncbi:phosphotransferase enzyme family protein [Sphingobacterium sp. Mn56C]|uniref:phosphotransferase enzyme family protein n=1 Tax=Sphingobacterium sp. Mn56C TaxID=3395261 RepID=UPI003BD7CE53
MSILGLEKIVSVIECFSICGEIKDIEPFGSGHINDTYKLTMHEPATTSYLLQKINGHIFQDVDGLMRNILLVTQHLKGQLQGQVEDVNKYSLTVIPCKNGTLYHQDAAGDFWRIFILLEDTVCYDRVGSAAQAYSAGQAFGRFQKQLSSLEADKLLEVLPNFHNIAFRMANLRAAMAVNADNRLLDVEDLLFAIFEREKAMSKINDMASSGLLPLRVIHNDTKFNNVLLDLTGQVQCVVDLDTVMPGYVAYDFGDAIRSIINMGAEDEVDLSKVQLEVSFFKAYTEGYLLEARDFLTKMELESLWEGVLLLPYLQTVRFLTDYLNGDVYYKVHYPNHNLVRTRAQFTLLLQLEKRAELLQEILRSTYANSLYL